MKIKKGHVNAISKIDGISKHTSSDIKKKKEVIEIGGPEGPEPTRFGDWEKNGRCTDF
jgi:hypothetical protein